MCTTVPLMQGFSLGPCSLRVGRFFAGRSVRRFAPAAFAIATVALCSMLGGARGAVLDAAGNVYVVSSPNTFAAPTTANAFQATAASTICGYVNFSLTQEPIACSHGYIQKISPDGKQLLAATYLGGSSQDEISSIATDATGNIYVTGLTSSTDFPVTSDAFQLEPGAAFFSVLSPDCSTLLYSTYLGFGTPVQILVDQSGRAILAGLTGPPGFPATFPVTSNNDPKQRDSFVVRFNLSKSKLEFAVEIGGTMDDVVQAAAVDSQGNIYISGYTSSTPGNKQYTTVTPYTVFPVTAGAYSHMAGVASVFVVKLDSSGQIVYATAFGGTGSDTSYTINVDPAGAVYLTGASGSYDFPITPGAFRSAFSQGFAAKIAPDASALAYSTFLGTNAPSATAVDTSGTLRAAGSPQISYQNFPATPDSAQPCPLNSQSDYYYLELNSSGSKLQYATLISAVYQDSAVLALSSAGQLYVSSQTALLSVIDAAARPPQGVTCIGNAASYRAGGIAPGEIVTLFGPSIGPADASSYELAKGIVGSGLGGVQVTFNGFPAPLLYVSADQINAIVPFEVAKQTNVEVQVTSGSVLLPEVSVPVVDNAPGIFTLDGSGGGQAAVVNQDGTINGDAHPAPRGSTVSMYITGAGLMQPAPQDGSLGTGKSSVVLSTAVSMLGFPATIYYSGDAPEEVEGLVQVNFQVPPTLYQTGYVPVDVGFGVGDISSMQQAIVWIDVK